MLLAMLTNLSPGPSWRGCDLFGWNPG